jgi:hypothetical protein
VQPEWDGHDLGFVVAHVWQWLRCDIEERVKLYREAEMDVNLIGPDIAANVPS